MASTRIREAGEAADTAPAAAPCLLWRPGDQAATRPFELLPRAAHPASPFRRRWQSASLAEQGRAGRGHCARSPACLAPGGASNPPRCRGAARGRVRCAPPAPLFASPKPCSPDRRGASATRSTGNTSRMRARPLSMTAVTPSTVTELSATFVARISFRCGAGETARSCSSGGRLPCRGSTSNPARRATALALAHRATDLRGPRQENQNVSRSVRCRSATPLHLYLRFEWLWRVRQMPDRKLEPGSLRAHDGTIAKILRHGSGIEGRRHDHDSQIGPRPLQAFQQCQREIAFEVALMKLIQHHRSHALQSMDRKAGAGSARPR